MSVIVPIEGFMIVRLEFYRYQFIVRTCSRGQALCVLDGWRGQLQCRPHLSLCKLGQHVFRVVPFFSYLN